MSTIKIGGTSECPVLIDANQHNGRETNKQFCLAILFHLLYKIYKDGQIRWNKYIKKKNHVTTGYEKEARIPAYTIHWSNAGLMLARRLRRRPNINPALDQCIVFAGIGGQQW